MANTLFEGPDNDAFRVYTEHFHERWIAEVRDTSVRMGLNKAEATARAEHLLVLIQDGWIPARARQSSDVIRQLTGLL